MDSFGIIDAIVDLPKDTPLEELQDIAANLAIVIAAREAFDPLYGNPAFVVDGLMFDHPDSDYAGDGEFAPFVILDVLNQTVIPGEYATRQEAQEIADALMK